MALMSPTIILLLNVIFGAAILALPVQLVDSSPIPHPVSRSVFEPRTATIWRHGLGNHGETLARECARLRGFKLYEIKAAGNQGIDFVAMRRGQLGDIIDVKFVEVKTTYNPTYRLSRTTSGQQLSRSYIAERLKAMHSSGDDRVRQLAHDISAFRRQSKVPLDRLAEVNHVDFSSGKLRFISPLTGAEKAHINIPDLLRSVEQKSTTSEMRVWAKQHRLLWSLSSSTNMASWTKSSSVTLGLWKVSHTSEARRLLRCDEEQMQSHEFSAQHHERLKT